MINLPTSPWKQRASLVAILIGLPVIIPGCFDNEETCDRYNYCGDSGNGGTSGGGQGGQGGGGQGGQGGGPPVECIPSEAMGVVDDSCGVFVSSSKGTTGGAGTKAEPVNTIAEALAVAAGRPIYLCGETFAEAVVMEAGSDVFGALDCENDWAYKAGTKSQINAPANSIAWKVSGAGSSTIADVSVTGATATDPGASSIAMLVDSSTVDLVRSELTAGDGATGGNAPADPDDPTLDGDAAVSGSNMNGMLVACVDAVGIFGGAPGEKTCAGSVNVDGGNGGNGETDATGGPGSPGNGPAGLMTGGAAGAGEPSAMCQGAQGGPGDPGTPGLGATGNGSIDATGYTGPAGGPGLAGGGHGEGGGGGGGANECGPGDNFAGPSGGGGGSGGCGGLPGTGGAAGGSSIALVSLGANVTLTACALTASDGGAGGIGSDGQEGGDGGQPGLAGGGGACAGGQGGKGGQGGAGGGGLGGHSLGIAFTDQEPTLESTDIMPGSEGPGGEGGDGGPGNMGGEGDAGISAETQSFD
jgi:hypothetical protein